MPAFVPVVYSGGAPVLSSGGSQRVACAHLAEWLVAYDALQVARGRGHVRYYQTMGGADASAGTHNGGSAWDMAWMGDAAIMDAREMGAAQWHRIPGRNGWPSSGADHCHGLIRCGDNGCNDYQFSAYLGGRNGLGLGGQGAGDPLTRPTNLRTWQQGIIWAHAEIARLKGTAPVPETTEDDMEVYAFTNAGSIGFRLRTSLGEENLNTMGEVDACLSAMNAKATREWDGTKWVIKYPNPCLPSEAQVLESKLAAIRTKSAQPAPAPVIDVVALATAIGPLLPTSAAIDYSAIADAIGDMYAKRMEN